MVWAVLKELAAAVDDVLAEVASVPLGYLDEYNWEKAMENPEFASIADRRRNRASGSLSWEDFRRQWQILEQADENPWWEESARFLSRRPMTSAVREIQFAWQRVTRGWDDSATWSLDIHLARTLGEQLEHLADTTHGWPSSDSYPEFTDWQFALRENAQKLRFYASGKFYVPESEEGSEDFAKVSAELEEQYREAQEAMRWIADNFGSLWD